MIFAATNLKPFDSNLLMMLPIRFRCTPSGFTIIKVFSIFAPLVIFYLVKIICIWSYIMSVFCQSFLQCLEEYLLIFDLSKCPKILGLLLNNVHSFDKILQLHLSFLTLIKVDLYQMILLY